MPFTDETEKLKQGEIDIDLQVLRKVGTTKMTFLTIYT